MKAHYVSVWDGGTTVTTNCTYNPKTKVVSNIESSNIDCSNVEGLEILDEEYIELLDGTKITDFIHEDDYEGGNELSKEEISKLKSIVKAEKTGQRFTVTLELETFESQTPLEAVQECLRMMLKFDEGSTSTSFTKQSCEGFIYYVTDNITGEKFTVDMSEDDENKVSPNND